MKEKHVVLETKSCLRCNAKSKVVIEYKGDSCFVAEVCDKCKRHVILRVTAREAYPFYQHLSILRRLKDRYENPPIEISDAESEGWQPANTTALDKQIKYLEERIQIFELGLNL